jgi:methionyl-tRNA formyltransferase
MLEAIKMENKNLGKKIAVAGNKNVTRDLIEGLLEGGYSIDHLITLHPSHDQVKTVSGYMDLWDFAKENKIGVYHPLKYNLKTEGDTENIKFLNLDLLIALGWQRLIPNWF